MQLPTREILENHVLECLSPYWEKRSEHIRNLPFLKNINYKIKLPLKMTKVLLPKWGENAGIDGYLLIPADILDETQESNYDWDKIDWLLACFVLMECLHEREHELEFGTIHSYSYKLKNWDKSCWEAAWVNRIAIFLRLWAENITKEKPEKLFESIPEAKIHITHDIDAIKKTFVIRIKQGVFNFINVSLIYLLKFLFKYSLFFFL